MTLTPPDPLPATMRDLPAIPYDAWVDTKRLVHRYLQILGKLRLTLHPKLNHWWHVSLYVTPRGVTTGPMPTSDGRLLTIDYDIQDHVLRLETSDGRRAEVPLADGPTVAEFYGQVMGAIRSLGVEVSILAKTYELEPEQRFEDDHEERPYDAAAVRDWWRVLAGVAPVMTDYRSGFLGKASPVHLFWHSFDLAVTLFGERTGRPLDDFPNPRDAEAYSHEVVSLGFWPGDDSVRAPTFYAYAAPAPDGLTDAPLPPDAQWNDGGTATIGLDAVRAAGDPAARLVEFYDAVFTAGARGMGWDIDALKVQRSIP